MREGDREGQTEREGARRRRKGLEKEGKKVKGERLFPFAGIAGL